MTRPARGCLLVLTGVAAVLIVIVLAMTLSKGVERKTVVELNISGSIQEEKDDSLRGRFLQGDATLISDLRALFDKARRDGDPRRRSLQGDGRGHRRFEEEEGRGGQRYRRSRPLPRGGGAEGGARRSARLLRSVQGRREGAERRAPQHPH